MKKNEFYIDIAGKQQNCRREKVCGDTFIFKRMNNGTRSIIVLSDGMGHGVKANILSNITATIIANMDYDKLNVENMARMILKSLPICQVRKASYSTFSIVDINLITGIANIIEYDNPKRLTFRKGKRLQTIEEAFVVAASNTHQTIHSSRFRVREGDRIVIMSDGVAQSGMGKKYRFGWTRDEVEQFAFNKINENLDISSAELASNIVWEAVCNDGGVTNDDVSCGVITIRKPKRLLLCTSVPTTEVDKAYTDMIKHFDGVKIIAGFYLASLIAEQTGWKIKKHNVVINNNQFPDWRMQNIDMVTESLVTLNQVHDILLKGTRFQPNMGVAYDITQALLENDEINIVIGKQRHKGWAYRIDDYDLRRSIMLNIISTLKDKYNKEVNVTYI